MASGTRLLDAVADDPRLFAVALPGAALVALGTVVQAVGLLRSRALPRWVPTLSLAIVLTFVVPGAAWLARWPGFRSRWPRSPLATTHGDDARALSPQHRWLGRVPNERPAHRKTHRDVGVPLSAAEAAVRRSFARPGDLGSVS